MSNFIRTKETLTDFVNKINKLIIIYAETYYLLEYLTTETISIYNLQIKRIDVIKYCNESEDAGIKDFYQMISSFVSTNEAENLLLSRYFPDYLTIKNICDILLYNMPRPIQKSDFEYLNNLYKKYNIKF